MSRFFPPALHTLSPNPLLACRPLWLWCPWVPVADACRSFWTPTGPVEGAEESESLGFRQEQGAEGDNRLCICEQLLVAAFTAPKEVDTDIDVDNIEDVLRCRLSG